MISVRKKRAVNLLAIVFLIVFFTTSCGVMPPPPVTQTESSQSEEREESSRSESPEEEPSQDGSPLEPKSEPKEDTIEKMELQTVDDLQFAVPRSLEFATERMPAAFFITLRGIFSAEG